MTAPREKYVVPELQVRQLRSGITDQLVRACNHRNVSELPRLSSSNACAPRMTGLSMTADEMAPLSTVPGCSQSSATQAVARFPEVASLPWALARAPSLSIETPETP